MKKRRKQNLPRWRRPDRSEIIEARQPEEAKAIENWAKAKAVPVANNITSPSIRVPLMLIGKSEAEKRQAREDFVDQLIYWVGVLQSCVDMLPKEFGEIAANRLKWPVLAARDTKSSTANGELLKHLGLGTKVSPVLKAEKRKGDIPAAKEAAVVLVRFIEALKNGSELFPPSNGDVKLLNAFLNHQLKDTPFAEAKYTEAYRKRCVSLPDLCKKADVVAAWQAVAKDLLMLNTDGKPEKILGLKTVGFHRRNRQVNKDVKLGSADELSAEQKMKNIRNEIRETIKDQIAELAP